MSDDCELLFFDTFSHDTCEELNLDLVQFPHPVYIFEIRVIPLGARVQADFPGGHRLGATNPSSFQLEFFVNDLSKRSASTFERLGSLDYKQNVEIQFPVANKIPTDGLVLRGWYSTVTLAVYGVITKVSNKDRSSPPPPPPHVNSRPPTQELCSKDFESSVSNSSIAEWDRNSRIPDAPPEPPPPPLRGVIEPHFGDVAPILHQPAPEHIPYSVELPVIGGFTEPPPPVPYQECVSVPQVIPTSSAYGQYDAHYNKPWPLPEAQYDHQIYNRPPDENLYQPNPDQSQPMWDIKDRLGGTNISSHERDNYVRGSLLEIPTIHRDKDLSKDRSRDRPWDRDLHDYKDDDRSRDHDSKRKDRGRRSRDSSWERSSADSDRYRERDRDRDRIRESSSRDRDRHRDRGSFMDRSVRKESKRPTTPPSPRKMRPHTPQTPPDHDRPGPRTPKEDEPSEMFDELHHGDVPPHNVNFYGDGPREHPPGEHMYNLSEGEIQDGENTEEDDGYEEIVSEEEDMSDGEERTLDIGEMDYDLSDESWSFMASFSPYQCELTSYRHFYDPTLFPFQIGELECKKEKDKIILEQKENEAEKILQSLAYPDEQDHDERWVEVLESITENTLMGLLSLKSSETFNGTIDQLCEWVIEGLDFDLALNQPQTAYKVRHLKAGIRLAILLFETKEEIIQKLLDLNIPKFLIELFEQPHMTLPVKLLILRSIDAVIATQSGMEYITTKPLEFTPPKEFDTNKCKNNGAELSLSKTCYQKLLEFTTSKQLTRCVVALSSLLNKIHTHEVLKELSSSVEKVIQNTEIQDIKSAPVDPPDMAESRAVSIEPELDAIDVIPNTCETLSQVLVSSLQEITNIYKNAWKQLAQTKRSLPARSQFEFQVSPFNPYPGLLRLFKQNKLLENIFVLLSSPALSGHLPILSAIKCLILELLESQEGMLFILSLPDVANGIQRTLLHTVDETREEASDENVAQNLGMQIVYHLEVLLFVDHLMMYHLKGDMKKELDDSEIVSLLHNLYTMMFTSIGKSAVVNVLSMEDNLNAIIPFVQISGDDVLNLKQSKSVCTSYATELLLLVVLFSDDALMIQKFSDSLFNISQQELTPKLHELAGWMAPTRNITNFTDEAIPSLMATLKSHTENVATLPPEIITALRMLQHIVLPKKSDSNESVELKYMYAIIQVFSNNGMESLKLILQNIATTFLKPSHQAASLVGVQGVLVMSIIKPAVFILKSILAHLISSRKTEFNDLTAVSILLKVYALMQLVPPSSFSHQQAEMVESEIIEALLTYTQPFLGSSESEEALSKSLWTEMVREILKFIQVEPDYFVSGLTVLSEMLPLPLPLQTREPLVSEEVTKMINLRKLWSAHLHSLCSTVQEVIVSLSTTSCHPLQQLLRRVCVQLADLAAPTALFIVRSVLDAVLEALVVPEQKENQDPATSQDKTPILKPPSSTTARMLTLVAYLVSHAAIKIPLMQVLKGSLKADENYVNVLPMMLELFNFPSDKSFVIQAQECTVSILQSFCDPDISFVTFENGASLTDVLSSSLPCNEHMSLICGALVRHIGCHNHSYSSVLPSLRTLVMLTEHDYGFFHVKQGLEQHPGAVYSLFTRFSLTFSKDSSDCLSTLSTTLEFLRFMVQGYEDGAQTGRTILLSACELAELLRGEIKEEGKSSTEPFQPIVELEKLLTEFGNDEEAVESLLESISSLLTLLNGASAKDSKNELPEPVLPIPENLSAQFALRSVFLVSGDVEEGRLSPAYWLALPGAEDTDQEIEQVTVDLVNTAERCISGDFNLRTSLENLCLSIDVDGDLNSKKKPITTIGGKRKYSPLINPAFIDVNNKRPFIAPMRGRGFSRASSHSSRINDPFRSRPPNTSRPPSMHVDDFLALESHHSAGNPGAQAKRTSKEGTRGRGRGFERNQVFPSTRGTGGRFFSPPGQYGRRDSNRGGNRGTNRLSSNTWGNRSNQNSGQKLSPGAGQRNSFGSHRNDYNSPFGQQDMRPGGQRNRDPYTDIRSSNIIQLGRFNRGSRTGGQQWQDNRNKSQNQRYY